MATETTPWQRRPGFLRVLAVLCALAAVGTLVVALLTREWWNLVFTAGFAYVAVTSLREAGRKDPA
ncbi:hypothetical protein [Pseudonocardia humida]|uniref:Uncharacterized protein n=1 Tax=Pseudonocardia humida TaxID=2800819 RepID=A0ABT0ZYK0_9PSEU|nr:hypothetical protein [Pseudonocardia humida]MCO1655745.1 hypothetical protein [Pseudonocardia humida]